jgi:hypothetical protein
LDVQRSPARGVVEEHTRRRQSGGERHYEEYRETQTYSHESIIGVFHRGWCSSRQEIMNSLPLPALVILLVIVLILWHLFGKPRDPFLH